VIRSAASREQAVAAAKEQFARLEGVRDWRFHASCIEVEELTEETSIREGAVQSPVNDPTEADADHQAVGRHRAPKRSGTAARRKTKPDWSQT